MDFNSNITKLIINIIQLFENDQIFKCTAKLHEFKKNVGIVI